MVTNVARHADQARTTVQLAYGERALTVSIDDHGPCVPGDAVTAGTGLTGMRERVTALGGTLDAAPRRIRDLTRREREVSALAARGLTNEELAAHMVISPFTAKTHISRAMIKLGARDRAQLIVFAYESGLVSPREPRR